MLREDGREREKGRSSVLKLQFSPPRKTVGSRGWDVERGLCEV